MALILPTLTLLILIQFSGQMLAQEPTEQQADEAIFSGPQVGEPLAVVEVQDALSNQGDTFRVPQEEGNEIQVVICVHERTRPSIGLARSIAEGLAGFPEPKPKATLVFLTDDPTALTQWAVGARAALPANTRVGISTDGPEGPGPWGLNRSVAMTIMVTQGTQVTDNFALVQPGVATDSPKVLQAVARAADVPWEQVRQTAPMGRPQAVDDETFRALMRPLLNRDADQATIEKIASDIEAQCESNPALKTRVGEVAKRIVDADKLSNYGNEFAQAVLKRWAESLNPPPSDRPNR